MAEDASAGPLAADRRTVLQGVAATATAGVAAGLACGTATARAETRPTHGIAATDPTIPASFADHVAIEDLMFGLKRDQDAKNPTAQHNVTNAVIRFTGPDTAGARSYFVVLQQAEGFALQPVVAGWYNDQFERKDGAWRFTARNYEGRLWGDLRRFLRNPPAPGQPYVTGAQEIYTPSASAPPRDIPFADYLAVKNLIATLSMQQDVEAKPADPAILVYPDTRSTRTHHIVSNQMLTLEAPGRITGYSYFTVFQAADGFPLQPIISGIYRDRFEKGAAGWKLAERKVEPRLWGDLRHHLANAPPPGQPLAPPARPAEAPR